MACNPLSQLAAGKLEYRNHTIGGRHRQAIANRIECDIEYLVRRRREHTLDLASRDVDDSNLSAFSRRPTGDSELCEVRVEGDRSGPLTKIADAANHRPGLRVPHGNLVVPAHEQLTSVLIKRDGRYRNRKSIDVRGGRVRWGRYDRNQFRRRILAIEVGSLLDPLLEQRDLFPRQRVGFRRHAFIRVLRGNSPKRLAAVQIARGNTLRSRVPFAYKAFKRVNSITTLGLLRPVARDAPLQ